MVQTPATLPRQALRSIRPVQRPVSLEYGDRRIRWKTTRKHFFAMGRAALHNAPTQPLRLGISSSTSTYLPSKREQSNSRPTHRQTHFSLLNPPYDIKTQKYRLSQLR